MGSSSMLPILTMKPSTMLAVISCLAVFVATTPVTPEEDFVSQIPECLDDASAKAIPCPSERGHTNKGLMMRHERRHEELPETHERLNHKAGKPVKHKYRRAQKKHKHHKLKAEKEKYNKAKISAKKYKKMLAAVRARLRKGFKVDPKIRELEYKLKVKADKDHRQEEALDRDARDERHTEKERHTKAKYRRKVESKSKKTIVVHKADTDDY